MDTMWKTGERMLRWGTLAYCSVFPAVSCSYNCKKYPCPVGQKYHENGPYQVTVYTIPPSVVMSCIGHKDYQSLKPYIEVASETQRLELSKWNEKDTKVGIITALEGLDAHQLELVYEFVKSIASKA